MKNGEGGRWWDAAKDQGQAHFGWGDVPANLLREPDWPVIKQIIRSRSKSAGSASTDCNQLRDVLVEPQRHIWITFQSGCLWWCTLKPGVFVNEDRQGGSLSHFWLSCDRPWSNRSLGDRMLATRDLPGTVTTVAGFRGTLCTPTSYRAILRVIKDEKDLDAIAASQAREAYVRACQRTVQRLGPKDFELLIDLILSRSGWARSTSVGKVQEGIDIDATHLATGDRAFVQVKSAASQAEFDDYYGRFSERRDQYDRLIFAVHSLTGAMISPDPRVAQIWTVEYLAQLIVRLGLGQWVEDRLA